MKVEVDSERCKGCKLCIEFCPKNVLALSPKINKKGYHPAFPLHPERCTGCLACILVCPDVAINVFKEETVETVVR